MHRTFETSTTRRQRSLDGQWAFAPDPDGEFDGPGDLPADPDTIPVPCAWNALPEHYDYHGSAWYRRTFHLPERANLHCTFLGVAQDATVFLDGERTTTHFGAYTPFSFLAPDLAAGEHELVVRVDNRRDETTVPKPASDWFPYGGITREVLLEEVPSVFLDEFAIEYDLDGGDAHLTVDIDVGNLGDDAETRLGVEIGGVRTGKTVEIPAGGTDERVEFDVPDVDRWSTNEPTLYDVSVTAGEDERRDRIGFREVAVEGREILVNGEPVSIRGVNRHEDHPEWGHAQPLRIMDGDIDLIEEGGFNAIRGSHYPNHPRFLDRCDEAGILVIEEIPFWQFDGDEFRHGPVMERGKRMLVELIERDRHHPSVFAWSVSNECANEEEEVYEATAELTSLAREADGSRLVTLASNTDVSGGTDECFELCDFICLNGYWGWYSEGSWAEFLDRVAGKYPNCPLIVSEFGGGAIVGERPRDGQKWSEPYQADLLEETVATFLDTEFLAGFTVWQFCDTRTSPKRWQDRPRTKNNKGIVGEYRTPKEAYRRLERLLADSGNGGEED
jgi:beta-glucuronidase